MRVFINVRSGSYSGGMILVAANTKEEAIKAFREDEDYDWMWNKMEDGIDDMYYGEDGWMDGIYCANSKCRYPTSYSGKWI